MMEASRQVKGDFKPADLIDPRYVIPPPEH
jgi:hypothetical protein